MKSLHMVCGGSWGGGPAIVLAITKALIERGDEVWVVTASKEQTRRFQEAGATVFELGRWIYQIHPQDLLTFVQLFLLCRRERFDLVTTHTSKGVSSAALRPDLLERATSCTTRTDLRFVRRKDTGRGDSMSCWNALLRAHAA